MIDDRFSLVPSEYPHVFHLRFSVVLPPERYYVTHDLMVIAEAKKQYPELIFDCITQYTAKFPDGQYANCVQCKVKNAYVEELVFSMPLNLDSIMAGTCGFKRAVPPIQYTLYKPTQLIEMTPDDFLEVVEDMYCEIGFNLRVRAVSWAFKRLRADNSIEYTITPTDYDYV